MKVFTSFLKVTLKRNRFYSSVLTMNLLTITVGATFAWSSPSLPILEKNFDENPLEVPINAEESSWMASISLLSATIGTIVPSFTLKPLGRRATIIILAFPVIIAYFLFSFTNNLIVFFLARILAGVTLGAAIQIIPMYVAEISEVKNRGAMGCCFSIFIAIGHLLTYTIGPFVSFKTFNLLSVIVPITFVVLVFFLVEESPYDFVANGNFKRAEKILRALRVNASDEEIKTELSQIDTTIKSMEEQLKIGDFISSRTLRKSLMISVSLAVFQQLSGINAVVSTLGTIFESVDGLISPEMSSIYVAIVQLIATFVTPTLIDRFGRTVLLASSEFFVSISLAGLGIYFFLHNNNHDTSNIYWLPLISLIIFIIFFNIGLCPIPYVLMGEIFPINARNVSSSVTSFVLTLTSFAVTWAYLYTMAELGEEYTFWIACGFSVIGFIFVLLFVPETKGKTFMEIQEIIR